ncbi:tyrosine--tRNA ligase [Phyllobacterium phragmitis]|uniref:Tyrosine--tRNA ligase n=1 Tax=Phyllobacterium phragmitis TaxID=2670329 RepID=A0A2S9IND6_9HYPH|nr:tyrosine--tRNA ligase [Phyllobacterium phragmitis]PRD42046.1 tyrosine--tRNA ligase [Phyllobacterium phragmitis]
MSGFKSDFLRTLSERGFIHQISDESGLDTLFQKEIVTGYIGFDPTASSLHVGGLIQIMMLHWMQQTGHRPVALMGGGTGMVGDPSFKDEARQLMTPETIENNIAGIKRCFSQYLTFGDGPKDAIMVNNADWLRDLNYLEFLRDVGRHFSVNRMLSFDSVKQRLDREQSLSFLEFNYMILQAYDFVELHQRFDVKLQMGGSDQWGNIVNGIDLGHRMLDAQFYALTSPLLTTASGAKMGKSMSGAVWLNADLVSPYDFWQYWRNTEDADVERFLKLYTTLPLNEIARLSALGGTEINETKKILATEVTALLHGRKAAEEAKQAAEAFFEKGATTESLPTVDLLKADWEKRSAQVIAFATGLFSSKSEMRRKFAEGAIRINGEIIKDPDTKLPYSEIESETGAFRVQFGKKRIVLVRPV